MHFALCRNLFEQSFRSFGIMCVFLLGGDRSILLSYGSILNYYTCFWENVNSQMVYLLDR